MTRPPDDARGAGFSFTKQDRLLRRSEFLVAQAKGRRLHATHFVVVVMDRGDASPRTRLGVTASRKAANSVGRNRVRRLIREVFRCNRGVFPPGCDCVVIVRENVPELTLAQVKDELLGVFVRRGRRPAPSTDASPRAPNVPAAPGASAPRDPKMSSPATGSTAPDPGGPRRQ